MMNSKLREVFEAAEQLSDDQQEELAAIIRMELESDAKWDALFASSMPQLRRMAREAAAEYHAGKTLPLDSTLFDEPNDR